jgi:hypothetical protein
MKCKNCETNDAIKYSKHSTGEFCSRECARAYSTKNNRLEINKKISEKLKGRSLSEEQILKMMGSGIERYKNNLTEDEKEQRRKVLLEKSKKICKSCGEKIESNKNVKYCNCCKLYFKYKELYKKLGVLDENLKLSNEKALVKLSKEYFTNKSGLIQIREKFGLMFNTVHFFFKKNGINLRTLSKAQKNAIKEGRKSYPVCKKYETGYHTTWYGKEVFYRSSYEKRMMEILDNRKEMYFYEVLKVEYEFDNEFHTHITDFYLPERNLVIEMKGEWFQKRDKDILEAKKNAVISEGYYHIMLGKKELEQYEKGKEF